MPKLSENQDSILSFFHKYFYTIVLLVIIALALSVRLYGINWDNGIAFTPHPDERAIPVSYTHLTLPTIYSV